MLSMVVAILLRVPWLQQSYLLALSIPCIFSARSESCIWPHRHWNCLSLLRYINSWDSRTRSAEHDIW